MYAWPFKTTCLTHKDYQKDLLRASTSKKRPTLTKKFKGTSRLKSKKGYRAQRLPLIEPFLSMSSNAVSDNAHGSSGDVSDNEEDTTIREKDQYQSTPIPTKDTGYCLRNHSYQQSVGGDANKTHKGGELHGRGQQKGPNRQEEDLDEMGSIEDLLPPRVLLKKEELEKKNNPGKFDAIFDSVNKLYNMYAQVTARTKALEFPVFDKEDGILPQLHGLATHAKDAGDKQELITKEVVELWEELDIAKGLIQKQNKQIKALRTKQVDLIARSMSENLTISGIKGDVPKADTKLLLQNFLDNELEIDPGEEEDIPVAHHLGIPSKGFHRPIVFKCPSSLKKKIFNNVQKLAGKNFSINQQLPDALAEQKREIQQVMKEIKNRESDKDEQDKSTFLIRNGKLYVNGQHEKKKLVPPDPQDLFVNDTDKKKMDKIVLSSSQRKPAKECYFQAFACVTEKVEEVRMAYKKLFRTFPDADHIAGAFSAEGTEGYQDDAEFGSGYCLLYTIRDSKLTNVSVFVVRYYGGENIGAQRFAVMKELAEEALFKLN